MLNSNSLHVTRRDEANARENRESILEAKDGGMMQRGLGGLTERMYVHERGG